MEKTTSTTLDRLSVLLAALVKEPELPRVDRWFSRYAQNQGWSREVQQLLWDGLRRALSRGYLAIPAPFQPSSNQWAVIRQVARNQTRQWAEIAESEAPKTVTPGWAGVPPWLETELSDRVSLSGWDREYRDKFLAGQERPLPVYVRFRWGSAGQECQRAWLARRDIKESASPGVYELLSGKGLESTAEWKAGLIEIQDASSQTCLTPLELRPGMRVWDLCAGRGGKTLLAANELRGKGVLVATDISEGKLVSLKERVRRSQWQNIRILPWNGETTPDFGPEGKERSGFDRVIVDAPCSATGTWRRDPEARFRLSSHTLSECQGHQRRLLRLGWESLKAGGRMIYITCSWLPCENEAIADEFSREIGSRPVTQGLLGWPYQESNTLFTACWVKP